MSDPIPLPMPALAFHIDSDRGHFLEPDGQRHFGRKYWAAGPYRDTEDAALADVASLVDALDFRRRVLELFAAIEKAIPTGDTDAAFDDLFQYLNSTRETPHV